MGNVGSIQHQIQERSPEGVAGLRDGLLKLD